MKICRLFLKICQPFLKFCRLFLKIWRPFLKFCRLFLKIWRLFLKFCRLFLKICRLFLKICRLFLIICRPFLKICRLFLKICRITCGKPTHATRQTRAWPLFKSVFILKNRVYLCHRATQIGGNNFMTHSYYFRPTLAKNYKWSLTLVRRMIQTSNLIAANLIVRPFTETQKTLYVTYNFI